MVMSLLAVCVIVAAAHFAGKAALDATGAEGTASNSRETACHPFENKL
jgi:hypothetical protein